MRAFHRLFPEGAIKPAAPPPRRTALITQLSFSNVKEDSSGTMVSKNRWGDLLEEEEELPAPTTSGPDAKGIVTKVEYFRNDKGDVMKRTTKTRVVKVEKKVYQVRRVERGGRRRQRPCQVLASMSRRPGGGATLDCLSAAPVSPCQPGCSPLGHVHPQTHPPQLQLQLLSLTLPPSCCRRLAERAGPAGALGQVWRRRHGAVDGRHHQQGDRGDPL